MTRRTCIWLRTIGGLLLLPLLSSQLQADQSSPACGLARLIVRRLQVVEGNYRVLTDAQGNITHEFGMFGIDDLIGPRRIDAALAEMATEFARVHTQSKTGLSGRPGEPADVDSFAFIEIGFNFWHNRHGHEPVTDTTLASLASDLGISLSRAREVVAYFGARNGIGDSQFGVRSPFAEGVHGDIQTRERATSAEGLPLTAFYLEHLPGNSVQEMRRNPRLIALKGGTETPSESAVYEDIARRGISILSLWSTPLSAARRRELGLRVLGENSRTDTSVLNNAQASLLSLAAHMHQSGSRIPEIARALQVSEQSLQNIFNHTGITRTARDWTPAEVAFMREHYGPTAQGERYTAQQIADILGRSAGAVFQQAGALQLTAGTSPRILTLNGQTLRTDGVWDLGELRGFLNGHRTHSDASLAERLGVSPWEVTHLRNLVGLPQPATPPPPPPPAVLTNLLQGAIPRRPTGLEQAVDAAIIHQLVTGQHLDQANADQALRSYLGPQSNVTSYGDVMGPRGFGRSQRFWDAMLARRDQLLPLLEGNGALPPILRDRLRDLREFTVFDLQRVVGNTYDPMFEAQRPLAQQAVVNRAVRAAENSALAITSTNTVEGVQFNYSQLTGSGSYANTYRPRRVFDSSPQWQEAYAAGLASRRRELEAFPALNSPQIDNIDRVLASLRSPSPSGTPPTPTQAPRRNLEPASRP